MKIEVTNSSNINIVQIATIFEANPIKGIKMFFISLMSFISDIKSLQLDQYGLISCSGFSPISFWIYGNLLNWLFFFLATLFKVHFTLYFIAIFIGYSIISTFIAFLPWIIGWLMLKNRNRFLNFKEITSIYLFYSGLVAVMIAPLNFYIISKIDYSIFIQDVPNYMKQFAQDWKLGIIYRILKYTPFFYGLFIVYKFSLYKSDDSQYSIMKTFWLNINIIVLSFWFQFFVISNHKIHVWMQEIFKAATLSK